VKVEEADNSQGAIKVEETVKAKVKVKVKAEKKATPQTSQETNGTVKRKRKTKQEKEAEAMPIIARTIGSKLLVGAHVSAAGGVQNSAVNSVHIGANAFALFLKNQRQWAFAPLQESQVAEFLSSCKHHKYGEESHTIPPIVPHGSYLVNLAHTEASRSNQAYESFIDDLDRCRRLGISLYNFHPGNAAGADDRAGAIKHIATQLNKAHKDPSSGKVVTLLETMAAVGGNTIGGTFEELADIIKLVEQKDRVGVCLDTCHVFAAGYDLRTPEAFQETMNKFDSSIGLQYLKALHMNDSKAPLASGRDLHANIGTGFLGLRSFWNIVNEPRLWGLPMVLETPGGGSIYAAEIKTLERMVGMDAESEAFKTLERHLSEAGKTERERVQEQVDRRAEKGKKKGKGKGKKKVMTSDEESGDE
jgi:AP endonuclease-1